MWSHTHIALQLLYKKCSGHDASFPTLQTNKKENWWKIRQCKRALKGIAYWIALALPGAQREEASGVLPQPPRVQPTGTVTRDACPAQNRRMQNIWEWFSRWQSAAGAAGIRMQEFGSSFQEHYLESVGDRRKTVRNPSFYLRSAQGARQGTRQHRPSWFRGAEGSRPPRRGSHPFPTRALHGTVPTPAPRAPALAPSDGGSCSTPQAGRDFFLFLPTFSSSAGRALPALLTLTSHGERSKERSSRDGRKGGGSRGSGAAARAAGTCPRQRLWASRRPRTYFLGVGVGAQPQERDAVAVAQRNAVALGGEVHRAGR